MATVTLYTYKLKNLTKYIKGQGRWSQKKVIDFVSTLLDACADFNLDMETDETEAKTFEETFLEERV